MSETTNASDDSARSPSSGGPVNLKSPKEAMRPQLPPKAPKRSRHRKNPFVIVLNFFFSFAVLGLIVAVGMFYWGSQQYVAEGPLEKPRKVTVPKGSGLSGIASSLARANVITSPLLFQASVRVQRRESELKHGEYLFEQGASMMSVVEKLIEGKALVYKVTLPEGWTSQQIVAALRKDEVLVGEITEVPEEGSLLPNTYSFGRGTTRQQVIDRMKRSQDTALQRIWESRVADLPIKTPSELVTLASIVEKETGQADERSRVASVFINRLNRGMKLQSDPTIIYGLFGGAGKPKDRPIYKSDIAKPTPYNTYTIDALPPGPITNPGLAAMEAVANPSRTDDIFFVADGTGGHAFAKTLEDHNNNVKRWRRIEAERKAAKKDEGETTSN
ncbi:MAG: endolytic transglycosylase MltG [Hyphomicrobiales bacterium]